MKIDYERLQAYDSTKIGELARGLFEAVEREASERRARREERKAKKRKKKRKKRY